MFDPDNNLTRNDVAWFLIGDFLRFSLWREKNCIAVLCIFSLIIVKSLQLCGHRQIAELHKYSLVRMIIFSLACVFSILFLTGLAILC